MLLTWPSEIYQISLNDRDSNPLEKLELKFVKHHLYPILDN